MNISVYYCIHHVHLYLWLEEQVNNALWSSVCCPVRGRADRHALAVPSGSRRVHLLCPPNHCQGQTYMQTGGTAKDLVFVSHWLSAYNMSSASSCRRVFFMTNCSFAAVLLMNSVFSLTTLCMSSEAVQLVVLIKRECIKVTAGSAGPTVAGRQWRICISWPDAPF